MEQDVTMDDSCDGMGDGRPRYSTPVDPDDVDADATTTMTTTTNGVDDQNKNSLTSVNNGPAVENTILRPGNIIMMTLTAEDYEKEYWPRLDAAIHQLLALIPGQYAPISYEQMYSCVYKCVCKQFSERLYADLLAKVARHLEQLNGEIASDQPKEYIEKFNFALNQYLQALGGIVPIFNYMNRFYVESKLGTDLRKELLSLFKTHVVDHHSSELIPLLLDAQAKPFMVEPAVMANVVKQLHTLCPELVHAQPQLFVRFIPNLLPPTTENDLERVIEETRRMQEALARDPDFRSASQGAGGKRALD